MSYANLIQLGEKPSQNLNIKSIVADTIDCVDLDADNIIVNQQDIQNLFVNNINAALPATEITMNDKVLCQGDLEVLGNIIGNITDDDINVNTISTADTNQIPMENDKIVKGITPYVKYVQRIEMGSYNNGWVHEDLNRMLADPIKQFLISVETDEDDEDSNIWKRHIKLPFPDKLTKYYDTENQFKIVKNEYRYGDVFVCWSPFTEYQTYSENDDVHLGNEGFSGEIHENTFILFTI